MTHYTYQDLKDLRLGRCLDTYLINIEHLVPCTVCDRPVISLPCNGNATKHVNC